MLLCECRIADPLLSMKDHIDAWTVLENNSTDNTTAVVKQLMRGKPGQVVHTKFKDFSTARNLALKVGALKSSCKQVAWQMFQVPSRSVAQWICAAEHLL